VSARSGAEPASSQVPREHGWVRPETRRFDLVLCDVDGCLVAETTAPFDLNGLAHVAEFNERAQSASDRPVLTPCTGRPQPFAEAVCRAIANKSAPAICENGVWLYHPGSNVYQLDPGIEDVHLHAVNDLRVWLMQQFGPRGVESHGVGISLQPGKHASVSVYHPSVEYVRSLMPVLQRELAARFAIHGQPVFRVSMTERYINCDLTHVSKATGIERALATIGIPKARLAGIGDMPSDLAIRERVAFFACPANAHESVKAAADYVSPHEQVHGVVDILSRLV
jgi:hydroxymethylpyrimidine pyrophosphatase-like HAD family hydrolase